MGEFRAGRGRGSIESLTGFYTKGFQDPGQRTEAGKGCLKKVQSDKSGKPEPVLVMIYGEQEAADNEKAGHSKNDTINIHGVGLIGCDDGYAPCVNVLSISPCS
jgi:anionic cell wall polymer biosynthesis LytR-Cps2A-Psr (LCP) family protein